MERMSFWNNFLVDGHEQLSIVLLALLALMFVVQLIYCLVVYGRICGYRNPAPSEEVKGVGLSVIIPLYNGALPCEMRKYELFDGKFKEFRESGEELDKSERPTGERRPLREREERAARTFGMKREEERPRRRFNEDNRRGFGDDRRRFNEDNRRPLNSKEMAERNDRERYEEDTNYSSLYERHHEFAKMQAARERKASRPQGEKREYRGGDKRDFRGGKPAGDKRGQRAQRFSNSKPNFKPRKRNED